MDQGEEKREINETGSEASSSPIYECIGCGGRVQYSELERYISFRCPYCGYRIFRKVRTPIVKRIKAR